jgi:hypothetical protein
MEDRIESLKALLTIKDKSLFNALFAHVGLIEITEVSVPRHLIHKPACLDLILGAPKEQRLNWIVSHKAVEQQKHLIFIPNEWPLNVR